MKKLRCLTLLVFTFSSIYLSAQVNENLLMERFNMNAFNPAYAGSEESIVFHNKIYMARGK